jgi:uncharacterized protein YndB with AHSA1/START domain
MTTTTETSVTTQVYRVYIKATPEAIWTEITDPDWTEKYGYGTRNEFDLRPGGTFRALANEGMLAMGAPEVALDGEIIEVVPNQKLVQTWRMAMDPDVAAEGFSRLTYEIAASTEEVSVLTVSHELLNAPKLAVLVAGEMESTGTGGGWNWVLNDLISLLETGTALKGGHH